MLGSAPIHLYSVFGWSLYFSPVFFSVSVLLPIHATTSDSLLLFSPQYFFLPCLKIYRTSPPGCKENVNRDRFTVSNLIRGLKSWLPSTALGYCLGELHREQVCGFVCLFKSASGYGDSVTTNTATVCLLYVHVCTPNCGHDWST